jgi:CBS domain containing-hemolysin-like protein
MGVSVGLLAVGGLLAKHLGKVPIPGSSVEVAGLRFTAEEAKGRRNKIGTVLITPVPAADDAPEPATASARPD